jgi:hypothetical protein
LKRCLNSLLLKQWLREDSFSGIYLAYGEPLFIYIVGLISRHLIFLELTLKIGKVGMVVLIGIGFSALAIYRGCLLVH